MKLRTRLLSAFVASSFLLVVLCGILAYRIAKNIMENHETTLTHNLANDMADLISPPSSGASPNLEALQDAYYPLRFWGQLVIIESKEGILYSLPTHSDLLQLAMENPLKTTLVERVLKQGQFKNDGLEYLWATVPIKNTSYMLTVVRPLQEDKDGTFKAIVTRLIVTSVIIFWLSAWGALIVSSWMAARLNKQNEAILYQALHDSLTNLPNRTSLFRALGAAIDDKKNQNRFIAVYVLDLDRFKEINDTIGHSWGDELLKQIASRLAAISNDGNTIARLGGDEFAILHISDKREDVPVFLNQIVTRLDEPFQISDIDLHINASLGVAFFPDDGKDPETLIQHAEVAMYSAKEKKIGHALYSAAQDPYNIRRLTLLGELKQAIYNNQLELHYQPKLNLRSGRVEDAEALVRWQHPRLGMISPAEFIPIAEQSGLIKPLTMWAIDRALSDRSSWSKDGINIAVAVNISTYNLHDDHFPDQIAGLLAKWHVLPSVLEMEITESIMMGNPERTLDILSKINKLGIALSLDDFGTGFSSLAYLKRLPVNQLKIDKSFVNDMETNENDRMIVQSIISLAHDLSFKVVAEGVESESVMHLLKGMGCDVIQGYHISRPLPVDRLQQWLKSSPQ